MSTHGIMLGLLLLGASLRQISDTDRKLRNDSRTSADCYSTKSHGGFSAGIASGLGPGFQLPRLAFGISHAVRRCAEASGAETSASSGPSISFHLSSHLQDWH